MSTRAMSTIRIADTLTSDEQKQLADLLVAEDANDFANPFGVNAFSGFNVNSIAIEVPAKRLTADGSS